MEMHQIRYFLSVAKHCNFTRAAEECHVAQPSLTRAIQKLEGELGGLLFHRERARTHLTPLGQLMKPHLEQTYQSAISAKTLAESIRNRTELLLRVGVGSSIASHLLNQMTRIVGDNVDGIELTLGRDREANVLEQALDGTYDLIVVSEPHELPLRMHGWPLFSEMIHVVLPAGHRFAVAGSVALAELAAETLIRQDQCPCFAEVQRIASEAGIRLSIRHHVASSEDLLHLVGAGYGIGILPSHRPLIEGVVAVPVVDHLLERRVILAVVAGRPFNAAADMCVKLAKSRSWTAVPLAERPPA